LKRKTASRTLLTLLLISMLTLTFNIQSAKAEPVTILSVYPPLSTALVGENFTINVTITDVVNLYGWQVNITFNPNILSVESAVEGPFLKQVNHTVYLKIIDNNAGYVLASSSFMPPYPPEGANGTGVLASVTFQVKAVGKTTIHFSEGTTKLRTWQGGNILPISYMAEDGFFTNLHGIMIEYVSPQSGPVGTSVCVNGSGATPNGDVRVYFDEINVANTTAKNTSLWDVFFEVPDVDLGDYTIKAVDVTTNTADTVNFTVRHPKTWIVDDDGPADFHKVQEAINAAAPRDTIFVYNGTYYENIVVDKTLTLIGENKDTTIIDSGKATAVKVTANNVVFKGFKTKISGWQITHILLNKTANTVVSDNNMIGGEFLTRGISVVTSNNITLRGNNITGPELGIVLANSSHVFVAENNVMKGSGVGLYESFNNTVANNNLTEITGSAISLSESFNNTISGNHITGITGDFPWGKYAAAGILMIAYPGKNGSSYNTFYDNDIRNCELALDIMAYSGGGRHHNNVFLRNYIANNYYGLELTRSSNIIFKDNTFSENVYNLAVYGDNLTHYVHDIDTSNTVNGKPVYYLVNQHNLRMNPFTFSDAGYLSLINSTNITVENLNLKENEQGLLMVCTRNSKIMNNNITNNRRGIYLDILSSNNTISGNNLTNQSWAGIESRYSFNNSLIRNTVLNNEIGIYLKNSFNNTLTLNTIANNSRGGVWLDYSFNNTLVSNNIKNNSAKAVSDAGVSLYLSYANKIFHNNFINNQRQAYTCPGNIWDDGYPSGGNYWSDYAGVDADGDGIGDTPYAIDTNNKDRYPLMNPWDTVPPIANAGPDQTVYEDTLVTFDGSCSSDNVGIVSYMWTLIDVTPHTLTGVNPTYTFTTPGIYTGTLDVSDAAGNHATDTITITVFSLTPADLIQRLTKTIKTWNLINGIETSLTSKLHAAYCSLDRKNENSSLRQLRAFINQVEALRLKKLTREQADYLITEAQRIVDLI